MRAPVGLKAGGGVYAQGGFVESLLRYLHPGEALDTSPVRWVTPPRSLAYPNAGSDTEYEFFGGVSQLGFNAWMHKWHGDRWVVASHHLWRYQQMSAAMATTTVRAGRGFRARDEQVVLLQLWDLTEGGFFCESVYQDAQEQVHAIGAGIAAARVARPDAHGGETAGVGPSDELGRLAELRHKGALTSTEWERAKAQCLGIPGDAKVAAMDEVERLYRLYKSGAISDYEFKRKKLELLTW